MLLKDTLALAQQLHNQTNYGEQKLDLVKKGSKIEISQTSFIQVYRGVIQINRLTNDHQKFNVVGWVTANHIFSNLHFGDSKYQAIALTDVYICRFTTNSTLQDSKLMRQILSEASYRLMRTKQMQIIKSHRKVEVRLKELLTLLKEEMGHLVSNGTRLTARFTHQNLAEAIGTTRVTITKIIGNLQSQNLLEFDRKRHLIIKF